MDILREVSKLPYYLYVFNERVMALGGQSTPINTMPFDRMYDLWKEINAMNQKESLSGDEKMQYAKNVQKMGNWNPKGRISMDELREKINSLNEKECQDIKWQIEMYKRGREFYRDYVHNK